MAAPENEIKYTINNARCRQVIQWLRCRCRPETQFCTETVSSIYYDTWGWKSLGEKINSDYLKTKIRVRWYSDIAYHRHYDASYAEAKFRIGYKRIKIRIQTPFSGERMADTALHDPVLLTIPKLLEANGVMLGENYFPVYQVTYKRMRFKEPLSGAKVCFDYDIAAPRVNRFMLPIGTPAAIQTSVLELKGSRYELPAFLSPLVEMGFRKTSFSKYSACFQQLTQWIN